jgi:hypothetical protein
MERLLKLIPQSIVSPIIAGEKNPAFFAPGHVGPLIVF